MTSWLHNKLLQIRGKKLCLSLITFKNFNTRFFPTKKLGFTGSRYGGKLPRQIVCYNCGLKGHRANQCGGTNLVEEDADINVVVSVCMDPDEKLDDFGDVMECDNQSLEDGLDSCDYGVEDLVSFCVTMSDASDCDGSCGVLCESSGGLLFCTACVGSDCVKALVDTGASHLIVSLSLVKKWKLGLDKSVQLLMNTAG